MARYVPRLACGLLVLPVLGSCIDFRDDLQCREDGHCHGLVCAPTTYTCMEPVDDLSLVVADVLADASGDGRVAAGEHFSLRIRLKNVQAAEKDERYSTWEDVTAVLAPAEWEFQVEPTGLQFGTMKAQAEACGTVAGAVPGRCGNGPEAYPLVGVAGSFAGTSLRFALELRHEDLSPKVLFFSVPLSGQ